MRLLVFKALTQHSKGRKSISTGLFEGLVSEEEFCTAQQEKNSTSKELCEGHGSEELAEQSVLRLAGPSLPPLAPALAPPPHGHSLTPRRGVSIYPVQQKENSITTGLCLGHVTDTYAGVVFQCLGPA